MEEGRLALGFAFISAWGVGGVFSIRKSTSSSRDRVGALGMGKGDSDEPRPVRFSTYFDLDHLEHGKTLLVIPLPDEVVMLMGRVVVAWGGFEARFNQSIESILIVQKQEILNWKTQSFRKRKKLYADIMEQYAGHLPNAIKRQREIIATAAELHWKRNIVAHGIVIMGAGVPRGDGTYHHPAFQAHGYHKGREVRIDLDVPTLNKLWHDIVHLGGDLMKTTVGMGGWISQGDEWLVEDTQLLQSGPHRTRNFVPIPKGPRPSQQFRYRCGDMWVLAVKQERQTYVSFRADPGNNWRPYIRDPAR